jgi:hypothetical protein
MFKSLSAVQKALGALPAAMEPSRVNGKWHAPRFSRRKLAELRKAALGFDLPWDWDRERKPVREREPKGHKHDRERPMREAKIAAALAKQPELVAAYRAKRKIVPTTLERLTMSTAELVLKRRTAVNPAGEEVISTRQSYDTFSFGTTRSFARRSFTPSGESTERRRLRAFDET